MGWVVSGCPPITRGLDICLPGMKGVEGMRGAGRGAEMLRAKKGKRWEEEVDNRKMKGMKRGTDSLVGGRGEEEEMERHHYRHMAFF